MAPHERCCWRCMGTPRVDPFMPQGSFRLLLEKAEMGNGGVGAAQRPRTPQARRGAASTGEGAPATAGVLPGDHRGHSTAKAEGAPLSLGHCHGVCRYSLPQRTATAEQLYGSTRKQATGYRGALWHFRNTPCKHPPSVCLKKVNSGTTIALRNPRAH